MITAVTNAFLTMRNKERTAMIENQPAGFMDLFSPSLSLPKNAHLRRLPCLSVDKQGLRQPIIWAFLSNLRQMIFTPNFCGAG
jgi:hypothetical protein